MNNIFPLEIIKYLSYSERKCKRTAKLLMFRSDPFKFALNLLQKRSIGTSFGK